MPADPRSIEAAKIITLSTSHLHPTTVDALDRYKGDLSEGPSIAVRNEGFLVNSHLGSPDALEQDMTRGLLPSLMDRFPDLTTIRALARGVGADWINIDMDGVELSDMLPSYPNGQLELPSDPEWGEFFGSATNDNGVLAVSRSTLEAMERGDMPGMRAETPSP